MRTINYTSRFKKDYKRVKAGRHGKVIDKLLTDILDLLLVDADLPRKYVDHALTGEWNDHRDCHLKPDLILIYSKPTPDELNLVRLGSHSELSL
jgi:mRNA interferase YafQ